jgi:phosphocarrier protein HPr
MVEKIVTIKNRAGIHARPAALLVQTANRFSSSIYLEKDGEKINSKSIMGILTLAATYNSPIKIIADGSDEEDAVQTIARLFETKFEEE